MRLSVRYCVGMDVQVRTPQSAVRQGAGYAVPEIWEKARVVAVGTKYVTVTCADGSTRQAAEHQVRLQPGREAKS